MDDTIRQCHLRNRLMALQNLCSDGNQNCYIIWFLFTFCKNNRDYVDDPEYPKALLFVAGPDGKLNKGSSTIIKYLFFGAVAKDLNDEILDSEYDLLEEIVILIKRSSVAIIWR